MIDELFSAEQVARSAGVRTRTLRRWARGDQPILQPSEITSGGHRRYTRRQLIEAQILGALKAEGLSTRIAKRSVPRLLEVVDEAFSRGLAQKSFVSPNLSRST